MATKPSNDAEQLREGMQLREGIERTREHLGETIEHLAAKADVKGRAQAQAAELAGRVKGTAAKARDLAAATAASTQEELADKTADARQKVTAVGQAGQEQLRRGAAKVQEAIPDSAQEAISKGADTAQDRWMPLTVITGAVLAVVAVIIWRRRRQ